MTHQYESLLRKGQLQGRLAGPLSRTRRNDDESHGFSEEDLPQLQDRARASGVVRVICTDPRHKQRQG